MILFEAFKPVWVSLTEEVVKEEAEGCGRRGERCPWRYRGFAPLGRTALKRPFVSKWLQLVMKMHLQANESILRSGASDSLCGDSEWKGAQRRLLGDGHTLCLDLVGACRTKSEVCETPSSSTRYTRALFSGVSM